MDDTTLDHAADDTLLACLLTRGGLPGDAALTAARAALSQAGGLRGLLHASPVELERVPGFGPGRARRVRAAMLLASRAVTRPLRHGEPCDHPEAVWGALRAHAAAPQERMFGVYLDPRLRLLEVREVARGNALRVALLPRDVLEPAVRLGAAALVLAHNHPSGDPTPSQEDIATTRRLAEAADLLGLRLLDHLVLSDAGYVSLAQEGLFESAPTGFRSMWAAGVRSSRAATSRRRSP